MTIIRAGSPIPTAWLESATRSAARHPDARRAAWLERLTAGEDLIVDDDTALGVYAWCSCQAGWDRRSPCITFAPHPDPADASRAALES